MIKDTKRQRRKRSEENIKHSNGPSLIDDLTTPVAVDGKPELNDIKSDILIEGIEDNLADP